MQVALLLGGYHQSSDRSEVPAPGQFLREVYIDYRCELTSAFMPDEKKYAYVDFVVTTPDGRVVFLEVDEDQHRHEPQLCETTRMGNVCAAIMLAHVRALLPVRSMNVLWLRMNPNSGFTIGGRRVKSPHRQRFGKLVAFLDGLKSTPSDPHMQIGYAFYDGDSEGMPLVLQDPDFQPSVRETVVRISTGSGELVQPPTRSCVDL